MDEIRRVEAELNEYHALSILAIAMNDREAYEGLQRMANEKYWPLFFRKMMFSTSIFFLLLTPYMLITTFFISPQALSYTMFIAIAYFNKLGWASSLTATALGRGLRRCGRILFIQAGCV